MTGSYGGSMAITIGLAGAGRRASEAYAPALAATQDATFGGVWAPVLPTAQRLAGQYGVRTYERFADLLDECDAVAFAVPPAAQPGLAELAAGRSRAVLLGMPLAADLAGAEQVARAVAGLQVVSQVALVWRYDPAVRRFLGTDVRRTYPLGGSARLVTAGPPGPAWRAEMGVLRSLGHSLVDLLDAALGPVGAVQAHGDPQGWLGLLLEHSAGRFSEASLYAAAAEQDQRADIEIFGSGGSAAMDCREAGGSEAFGIMLGEFAAAAARGAPHELDAEHGLRIQRVIGRAEAALLGA